MAKKQHRSQENLRNVALANASKPQKADRKPQKPTKEIIVSVDGMDEFCPRAATKKVQDGLKNKNVKKALIVSKNASVSVTKLKTEFGKPVQYRAATTTRKSFTGSKKSVVEFIGEHIAMSWQRARGNA